MTVRFEDIHPAHNTYGYATVNEDIDVWDELLQGLRVRRVAGICSGGEVALFSLLRVVRNELTLVDHSYESLSFALAKYMLIREQGWEATYKLFSGRNGHEVKKVLEALTEQLPGDGLQTHFRITSHHYSLAQAWVNVRKTSVRRASTKLDKVQFLHGDLQDLEKRGKFGMLYISNALEHQGRDRTGPRLLKLGKLVRPGGYVCLAGSFTLPDGWELLNKARQKVASGNTSVMSRWDYSLLRTPEVRVA